MLFRNAFGNLRTLLEQVATHPAMEHYFSHVRNEREDPVTGRIPDENFARKVMQLFSIGLWQLNPDGTRRRDGSGNFIPTYTQEECLGWPACSTAALMDRLNLLLTAGRMTPATRQVIINAINEVPASSASRRAHMAVTLTMISPEFIVQK